ncbi:uncharacterized protein LOC111024514 [Momordica charantia]|uniref:Uncharacterized protein LOC111024514 n=1 Tax=Momordica charantia TaxID=3673 RepID=A0A6J1DUB6_MOMCH|nr:uncharacterized protein LOC111024514 [Momordica charantia]
MIDITRRSISALYCTHWNLKGHTIDRCYKLHGYPPGYKQRNTTSVASASSIVASDKQTHYSAATNVSSDQSDFFSSLNTNQYAQLMDMFHVHLSTAKIDAISTAPQSHVAG